MTTIGPTMPPHLTSKRKRSSSPSPSTSPSTSPQPPTKRSRPSSPSLQAHRKRQPIGPALPPASLSDLPTTPLSDNEESNPPPNHPPTDTTSTTPLNPRTTTTDASIPPPSDPSPDYDSSDEDDDDFGPAPAPLPSTTAAAHEATRQRTLRDAETAALAAAAAGATNKPPQREEWMLAPPSNTDWGTRLDPTKLKNRRFQTGKSARDPPPLPPQKTAAAAAKNGEAAAADRLLWTETPEQKRQRLRDEVLGVKSRAENATAAGGGGDGGDLRERRRREEDEEKGRRVREYNERRDRGGSLMEGWKGKRDRGEEGSGEKEDDPSARVFDREKDVGLAVKIGHKARGEMMHKAKDFGGRFAGGKYL